MNVPSQAVAPVDRDSVRTAGAKLRDDAGARVDGRISSLPESTQVKIISNEAEALMGRLY
jgi:hypothetical protein